MVTIYLSGGIKGLTDEQAFGWRFKVCLHYGCREDGTPILLQTRCGKPEVKFVIPTRIQYRPDMDDHAAARWLCKRDKIAVAKSDIILVYAPVPSWGTAMEILYAYELDKWIVTVCDDYDPSPWLVAHSDVIVPDFKIAYDEIDKIVKEMGELHL